MKQGHVHLLPVKSVGFGEPLSEKFDDPLFLARQSLQGFEYQRLLESLSTLRNLFQVFFILSVHLAVCFHLLFPNVQFQS